MNKYSARLLEKIEGLCEYLNHTRLPPEEIEAYYAFCYALLVERRKLDESGPEKINDALLKDDVSRLHLALHELIYDKN